MAKLNIGSGIVRKPGYVSVDKYESNIQHGAGVWALVDELIYHWVRFPGMG